MSSVRESMAGFGANTHQIEQALSTLQTETAVPEYTVHFDNWQAWEVFRRVQSQFTFNHFSGRAIALDYSALTDVISLFDTADRLELFDAVRLIERGYLDNLPD